MSKLQQYLERVSNEDADLEPVIPLEPVEQEQVEIIEEQELEIPEPVAEVSEDALDEAEFDADEATDELEELPAAVEEVADVETEVTDEMTSIEEFVQVMRHGVRTKAFSPQTAALAQQRLTRLANMFGDENTGKASLENFNGETLGEYYNVSIEAFEGFLKRLSDVLMNATKGLADKLNQKWVHSNYVKKAQELNLRADAILAGAAKAEPAVIKGKVAAKDFQFGGVFNGNILESINKDMRFLSGPGAALIKNTDTYLGGMMNVIEDAVKNGGVGKTGDIVAKVLDLKRPVDQLPEEAFKAAMAGGLQFTKTENKGKEGDRRGAYKDIVRGAIPGVNGTSFKGDAADITIDKPTADKIARAAKAYTALALKVVEAQGLKSLETFYRRIDVQNRAVKGANATSWGENKDLNVLAAGLLGMGHQQFTVYYTLLMTAFDNIGNALDAAERAVGGAAAKAAE